MLTSLSSAAVYRLRPGTKTDSVGDTVLDHANPQRTRIPRAQFQMRATTSTDGVVITSRDQADLLIVGAFDLTAADRIEVDGKRWRIDGDPIVRRSLASGAHTEAALVRDTSR